MKIGEAIIVVCFELSNLNPNTVNLRNSMQMRMTKSFKHVKCCAHEVYIATWRGVPGLRRCVIQICSSVVSGGILWGGGHLWLIYFWVPWLDIPGISFMGLSGESGSGEYWGLRELTLSLLLMSLIETWLPAISLSSLTFPSHFFHLLLPR